MVSRGLVMAGAIMSCTVPCLADSSRVRIGPVPEWVDRLDVLSAPGDLPLFDGSQIILNDREIRVTGRVQWSYLRTVEYVASSAGRTAILNTRVSFDPSYQAVILHEFLIHRGAGTIRLLSGDRIAVHDVEQVDNGGSYRRLRSIDLGIEDVRVGDTVDFSYTVVGANPVFDGVFGTWETLAPPGGIGRERFRVIMPAERTLYHRTHGFTMHPDTTRRGPDVALSWDLERAQVDAEVAVGVHPMVEVSELPGWGAVAQWGEEVMRVHDVLPDSFDETVEAWRSKGAKRGALEAVRFVQDEIEYMHVQLGENSHRPRPASEVLESRYGDCKDKAVLLVALLRRLGRQAYPALVNTQLGPAVDQLLPSFHAFDHVVVVLRHGDASYWIDPTLRFQGGRLDSLDFPNLGRALVLAPGASGLGYIEPTNRSWNSITADETYSWDSPDDPVRLHSVVEFRGGAADEMRGVREGLGERELDGVVLHRYRATCPWPVTLASSSYIDDRDSNRMLATLEMDVPGYLPRVRRGSLVRLYAPAPWIAFAIAMLDPRESDLALLPHPWRVRESIHVILPGELQFNGAGLPRVEPEGDALAFELHMEPRGPGLRLRYELGTRRPWAAGTDVERMRKDLSSLASNTGLYVDVPAAAVRSRGGARGPMPVSLILVLLVAASAAVTLAVALLRRLPAPSADGVSPSEASGKFPALLVVLQVANVLSLALWVAILVQSLMHPVGLGSDPAWDPLGIARGHFVSGAAIVVIVAFGVGARLLGTRRRIYRFVGFIPFALGALTMFGVAMFHAVSPSPGVPAYLPLSSVLLHAVVTVAVALYLARSPRAATVLVE